MQEEVISLDDSSQKARAESDSVKLKMREMTEEMRGFSDIDKLKQSAEQKQTVLNDTYLTLITFSTKKVNLWKFFSR